MNARKKIYETRDFYLACFLKTIGLNLINVVRSGKVAVFCFEGKQELDQIITAFYNGTEKVSAIAFINSIRDLKALIHNI